MAPPAETRRTAIPSAIWALGLVSLTMDASSELVHSLLPVFMVTSLGASVTAVGIVEGIAEATALLVKIISGTVSDYLGRRKLLALLGYGLAAVSKPLFPLAESIGMVLAARFIDRIGKGIRGAPRDALVADIAPEEIRGACFGLRQSLDTVGAFIGPILAMIFMVALGGNIRAVLWVAIIPAVLSVAILAFAVKEPEARQSDNERPPLRLSDIRYVGAPYWRLVVLAVLLTMARFSEAFLVLKAQAGGLADSMVPAVMVVMSLASALSAYPAGKLSDRANRNTVMLFGVGLLIAADLVLGFTDQLWTLAVGVSLWGLHLGFTQGLLGAMVADAVQPQLRGTAYGVLNFACGIAMLLGSVLAGVLWDHFGSAATFLFGAAFAAAALLGFAYGSRQSHDESSAR